MRAYEADEYLTADGTEYGAKHHVYLSLFDIDSFRRIQQLTLRGMIYSDEKRDVCPFCGQPLSKTEHGDECAVCRTLISQHVCPDTGEGYFTTAIHRFQPTKPHMENNRKHRFLLDKYAEAQLFYRNVTSITTHGEPICPKCGKYHG